MDQTWSNLIKLDLWWNNHWNISSDFQLYFFLSDLIRSVQNGSDLIKFDQIGFPCQSKNVTIKSCCIYRKDKNGCFVFVFFWIRSVQNGSNLIKWGVWGGGKCEERGVWGGGIVSGGTGLAGLIGFFLEFEFES